jgi:hypothetical protein
MSEKKRKARCPPIRGTRVALYRVAGVRANGKRVVLTIDIRIEQVRPIIDALAGLSAFASLAVEPRGEIEFHSPDTATFYGPP